MERTDGKGFFSLWELLALQAVDRDQVKNGNNLIARSPEKGARTKVKTGGTKEGPRWQIWVEVTCLEYSLPLNGADAAYRYLV